MDYLAARKTSNHPIFAPIICLFVIEATRGRSRRLAAEMKTEILRREIDAGREAGYACGARHCSVGGTTLLRGYGGLRGATRDDMQRN